MSKGKTIVISDLHVGAGELDDCDEELQNCLVSFLDQLSSDEDKIELVVNGDFLDFVQARPWQDAGLESVSNTNVPLCFTEDQSVEKLESIVNAHAPIFAALGRFLAAKPDNKLIIMPGNHDVDFFWPRVRSIFMDKVCEQDESAPARLHFYLERVYRPPSCPQIWVEHGNNYDPINCFKVKELDPTGGYYLEPKLYWSESNPPIFKDANGAERLYECIGTRLLIKYMNQLDADYPFVDNVKPFSRFVRIFGASALVPGYGFPKVILRVWGMLSYLIKEGITSPSSLMGINAGGGAEANKVGPSAIIKAILKELTPDEFQKLTQQIKSRGFKFRGDLKMFAQSDENATKLMDFLADNLDLIDDIKAKSDSLLGSTPGTLSLVRGFNVKETNELIKAANNIVEKNRDVIGIIMGHTHEPVKSSKYINTGCWTRYYIFTDDEKLRPWKLLKNSSFLNFPYQLNYAEIIPEREEQMRAGFYLEKTRP
ncbi:MAG TPA: metallophosphoesterase [Pyrinomonadaceae bacterium]|nr:metallophosphoesterase [Pyrinomonadaceae bacterium]